MQPSLQFLLLFFIKCTALPTDISPKIYGGFQAQQFNYPWITSIQYFGQHVCGGVLIDDETVITTANCGNQTPFKLLLRVHAHRHRLSDSTTEEDALVFKVISMKNHPRFNSSAISEYNISVWKVQLIEGNPSKIPIDIVKFDDGSLSQDWQELVIAGWGSKTADGPFETVLMEAPVFVMPNSFCANLYPSVTENSVCARGLKTNVCRGDLGGPLFVKLKNGQIVLVGISSFGWHCDVPYSPSVYAKISMLRDWIVSVL